MTFTHLLQEQVYIVSMGFYGYDNLQYSTLSYVTIVVQRDNNHYVSHIYVYEIIICEYIVYNK